MASLQCYLLLSALSLFAFFHIATSIRCFVCTTVVDGESCADPFNKTAVRPETCDVPTSVCVKQILPALGKFNESIHRSCGIADYCKQNEKGSKHCSSCNEPECNSSFTISPSFSIISVLTACYIYNILIR